MAKDRVKLDKYGRIELSGHIIVPLIICGIFFLTAGRIDQYRYWIWTLTTILYYIGGMMILLRFNPLLLNERGGINRKKDSKKWDKILLNVFALVGLYGHIVLMGLDAGRYGWSGLQKGTIIPGLILYALAFLLVYWSMAVNTHFETTVRIQHDRNHKVISNGPYRFIRHPGYLGLILINFASTMIIGSAYGFITACGTFLVLGIRTLLEDRTLTDELEGYEQYTKDTRYRLIPFLW
ncbi:methyltransferase family protein [Bacteroidota bacterium]